MSYSLEFNRSSNAFRFGSGEKAFGTTGAGGSFDFADPEEQVGFAYGPNKIGFPHLGEPARRRFEMQYTGASKADASGTHTSIDTLPHIRAPGDQLQ